MKILAVILLALAPCVAGDAGDDFSNNLFSDLAPLLALFGERVAMQFLSESMGWLDNIIFAMAPIGIITAIVATIRVGGPSWLQAIIGRSRENRAAAEVELMSSTSNEVCELWNGTGLVRLMGEAPIREFICLIPRTEPDLKLPPKIKELKDVRGTYLEEEDMTRGIREEAKCDTAHPDSMSTNSSTDREDVSDNGSADSDHPRQCIIIRNTDAAAPNISLNIRSMTRRRELGAAAVAATMIQLGVLVYAGFATHYPTMQYTKNDLPIAGYAFPCMVVGTLVLVAGMFTCAHVVDSSTVERRYRPKGDYEVRIIWLQREGTVNDQSFGPFALYPAGPRDFIITSSRGPKDIKLKAKAVVATLVSLCGFLLQFIGLRGLYWSVSVAQLGATIIMVGLRAWIRRASTTKPHRVALRSGYEMDWLATTFDNLEEAPWRTTSSSTEQPEISKPFEPWAEPKNDPTEEFERGFEFADRENSHHDPTTTAKCMLTRIGLGQLARWRGPGSAEAVSLAKAMEIVLNSAFKHLTEVHRQPAYQSIFWFFRTRDGQSLTLRFTRSPANKWEASTGEVDAALSLSTFAVSAREEAFHNVPRKSLTLGQKSTLSPSPDEETTNYSLRVLGQHSAPLARDLSWWFPTGLSDLLLVGPSNQDESTRTVLPHRVVGFGLNSSRLANPDPIQYREETERTGNWTRSIRGNGVESEEKKSKYIAKQVHMPLSSLYALDIFSMFFRDILQNPSTRFSWSSTYDVIIQPLYSTRSVSDSRWEYFRLQIPEISTLARDIHNTGLGSLEDIFLSIIPTLSVEGELPLPNGIFDMARQRAKEQSRLGIFSQAANSITWPLDQSCSKDGEAQLVALALVFEYLILVTDLQELREKQKCAPSTKDMLLSAARSCLVGRLKDFCEVGGEDTMKLIIFKRLLAEQNRNWGSAQDGADDLDLPPVVASDDQLQELGFRSVHRHAKSGYTYGLSGHDDESDIMGWTGLHYAAAFGTRETVQMLLEGMWANPRAQNMAERTPLHYVCARNDEEAIHLVDPLLEWGADLNAKGIDGTTPLHVAAMTGNLEMVNLLVSAGANPDVQDNEGNCPLHWAAFHGHCKVVQLLASDSKTKPRNYSGRTAFHLAAVGGHVDLMELLCRAPMSYPADAEDWAGWTALHMAAANGHNEAVDTLLQKGISSGGQNKEQQTPLHIAAIYGHGETIEGLLQHDLDINAVDSHGRTPLFLAVSGKHVGAVKALIIAGANVNTADSEGWSPLHQTSHAVPTLPTVEELEARTTIAKLLLEAKADTEVRPITAETPLWTAVADNQHWMVKLLIEATASVDLTDSRGMTILHMAVQKSGVGTRIVEALLRAGAKKDVQDENGKTPLDLVKDMEEQEAHFGGLRARILVALLQD